MKLIDNGFEDYKIISVVNVDPRYNEINELKDLSEFILEEIKNFFENYKSLQNIKVEVGEYYNKEEALKVIEDSINRYKETK